MFVLFFGQRGHRQRMSEQLLPATSAVRTQPFCDTHGQALTSMQTLAAQTNPSFTILSTQQCILHSLRLVCFPSRYSLSKGFARTSSYHKAHGMLSLPAAIATRCVFCHRQKEIHCVTHGLLCHFISVHTRAETYI